MAAMQLHGLVFGLLLRPRSNILQTNSDQDTEDHHSMRMLPKLLNSNLDDNYDLRPIKQNVSDYSNKNSSTSIRVLDVTESDPKRHNPNNHSTCNTSESCSASKSTDTLQISHISEDFTTKHHRPIKYPRLWKYLPWILFFLGNWLVQSCHVLITVLTPVRAHWFGIENHLAALLVSIYGVSSGVSR